MKTKHKQPRGERPSKLTLILALLSLLAGHYKSHAQGCTQLPPAATYSRVINQALFTNEFLQADYDVKKNNAYVPSTYTATGANMTFLSKVHYTSPITWSYAYPFTGTEIAMATKKASNGDELIAGTTVTSSGSHVIYLMRVDSNGNYLWAHYYPQTTTDVTCRVIITETTILKDIIVAASSQSSSDDLILIRVRSNGALKYYDDHPIYAAANTDERYPQIFGITPTFDDGYVIVGSTGHQWDFYAATIMKYDRKYNVTPTHAMNWHHIYRHPLGTYDLWVPGERSSTFARGVTQNPKNDNIIVVGRQGDNDQYGTSTTYQNGFILVFDSSGNFLNIANYVPANGHFLDFQAVNMTGSDYIISGSDQDPSSLGYQTLITKVSSATLNPFWSYLYGNNGDNISFNIFPTLNGYMSVGISNDNITPDQPNVLAVNANGQAGSCYTPLNISYQPDNNDEPALAIGPSVSANVGTWQTQKDSICAVMYEICGSKCPQLSPKTHYSRVINDTFNTNNWLQADYDSTGDSTYVPSTYVGGSVPNEIFWSNVALNSSINFSNRYNVTGNENALAIKKTANGEILIAGHTVDAGGNHVLFLMRTTSAGVPIWYEYFDQNNTDLNSMVVLTETAISHDIVVASSSNSLANDVVLLRTNSAGTLLYYDDHPIFAAGNTVEHYPTINGITPTHDDGFVVVGSTGHNWDFFAATIFKYDAYYNSTPVHALDWWYMYRHKLTAYDLWVAGERSATYAHCVIEEPNANHHIVVAGWRADNDQYGTNATYQYGWVMQLDTNGSLLNTKSYVNGNSWFISFNGICIDNSGNYVLTGSLKNPNTGNYQTLIMKVASVNLNPVWAELYGTNSMNMGFSIFKDPNGFISIGITNDNSAAPQPYVLSVDANGLAGQCYTSVQTDFVLDVNDEPSYNQGSVTTAQAVSPQVSDTMPCEAMVDLCSTAQGPELAGVPTASSLKMGDMKLYPNPASDKLNLDMMVPGTAKGMIIVKDVLGNDVLTSPVTMTEGNNHFEVNISALKEGIYFVQIVNDKNTINAMYKVQKF